LSSFSQEIHVVNKYQEMLNLANSIRFSKRVEFNEMIELLILKKEKLTEQQKIHLTYLRGYQRIIAGDLAEGIHLLDQVINQHEYSGLKHKATITKMSVLNASENYQAGFTVINKLLPMLDIMKASMKDNSQDKESYHDALFVVAVFYNKLAQYDLSKKYLALIMSSNPSLAQQCSAIGLEVEAMFRLEELTWDYVSQNKAAICEQGKEYLIESLIHGLIANWYIQQNEPQKALDLLTKKLSLAHKTQYYLLVSQYEASIAHAHLLLENNILAKSYATKVLSDAKNTHKSEWIAVANLVMYKAYKKEGDYKKSLHYFEVYQNKLSILNDNALKRNISYQIAQAEVKDKAHQISLLDGKNKVLELEKKLFKHSEYEKILLIVLLLIIAFALGIWAYLSKKAQLRLKVMAEHDELTGVFNRYSFNELAGSALNYCKRTDQDVSLILFDLDNFKLINDTYGHQVGDWVLKETVNVCKNISRNNDIIGRYGGEEFTILLPGCNEKKAVELAEKYRKAVFEISTAETGFEFDVSASFGLCPALSKTYTLQDMIKSADEAMYQAKHNGRNQVRAYKLATVGL
jgi:diguanylate cyclase (GGDEF)-like protein